MSNCRKPHLKAGTRSSGRFVLSPPDPDCCLVVLGVALPHLKCLLLRLVVVLNMVHDFDTNMTVGDVAADNHIYNYIRDSSGKWRMSSHVLTIQMTHTIAPHPGFMYANYAGSGGLPPPPS